MRHSDPKLLSANQRLFADEYLVHGNASRAYRTAYPAAKDSTSRVQGCRLLAKPNISAYIAERRAVIADRYAIDQERVLNEYARIAFFDPRCLFDKSGRMKSFDSLMNDEAAAISSVDVRSEIDGSTTIKIRFSDKRTALDSLARHLGMFNGQVTAESKVTIAELIKRGRERCLSR